MFLGYERFDDQYLRNIHEKTLAVLEKVGLKILYEGFYPGLEAAGARIDRSTRVVKFPPYLIEKTIADLKEMIQSGRTQHLLNGVISSKTINVMQVKFAGACIEYLDPLTNEVREPSEEDLIRLVKFGESLPEVTYVGNPVCYLRTASGDPVPGPLQRVMTAALVGKHTTKYGSNEVWNEKELDLLIELGTIVRGGKEEYFKNPCFVTAKETIAPLLFPEEDGRVLSMLAERGLPCTIIPMPISGVTSPVTIASNIVMTAAEVLGVMTTIHCSHPDALIGGGVISGVMDMKTGNASFAAPEAILQDLGAAMLFERLYGQDFGIGTGCIDAQFPGSQLALEYTAKITASKMTGRCNYPFGNIGGAKRFSPIGALVGLEIAKYMHANTSDQSISEDVVPIELFEEVGISGSFLGEMHTVENFRKALWMPELIDRMPAQKNGDRMIEKAKDIWSDFLKKEKEFDTAVDSAITREIDSWLTKAIKIINK